MLNFNYALKLSKQSAYTFFSTPYECWGGVVVLFFFFLSLETSAWQSTGELPSVSVIVCFSRASLWKACLVSDHVIKETHSVFKSVNALYLSHEREEINYVKCFLVSSV